LAVVGAVLLLQSLVGCEAPLNMAGVDSARENPIHRTDRYQAIATHGSNVVVVGNQGIIISSPDFGTTWRRVELSDWPALIDVTVCPDGRFVALAFAPMIFVSDDSGISWTARPIPSTENPQALTCAPNNRIWVVGAFTNRWSSTDGGATWLEATDDEDAILTTVQFFDANSGVITGEFGTVMTTTNGGETWNRMPVLVEEFYPQATYFRDPETGWIAGLGGVILHTSDGGENWVSQETETVVPLYGLEDIAGTVFAVGGEGTLLKLKDNVWRAVNHGKRIRLYIRAIRALDSARAIIAGVGGTLHIVDIDGA